jgi:hypothetical protein
MHVAARSGGGTEKAFELLKEMQVAGVQPTVQVYSVLMGICARKVCYFVPICRLILC